MKKNLISEFKEEGKIIQIRGQSKKLGSIFLACSAFIAFSLWLMGENPIVKAQGLSKDPAAPTVGCDPSCHNDPSYMEKKGYIHKSEECVACHMGAEEIPREKSNLVIAAEIQKGGRPQKAEKGKRRGTDLVKDQKGAIAKLKGKKMVLPKVKIEVPSGMVYIPAGEFIMGSNDRWPDEAPEHVVYVNAYFIDKYEVTNAEYRKFVQATGHRPPDHWLGGKLPDEMAPHPVTYVTWVDAIACCQWQGKRLPIEQEWEKAARGTDGRTYPWGNEWDESKSNNPQRDSKGTEPVGSYENGKGPYGLYDMSGNVWEWVDAWYKPHPGNTVASEEYGEKYKVAKGGSWYNCLFYNCGISAPTYNRSFFVPETKNNTVGFRCAKDAD